ncbi:unnamed protein product, partial [Prorocentrum cordatum]
AVFPRLEVLAPAFLLCRHDAAMVSLRSACQLFLLILVAVACILNALVSLGASAPPVPAADSGTSSDAPFSVAGPAAGDVLYRGCGAAARRPAGAPNLTIIGVQKGGTTFLGQLLGTQPRLRDVFCTSKTVAGAALLQRGLLRRAPAVAGRRPGDTVADLETQWSSRCFLKKLTFEKSPAAYLQPWIPLRLCASLPSQKIVLLLRNPTSRAYSGFYQAQKVMRKGAMTLDRKSVTFDEMLFHELVLLELAIATTCRGLFTGTGEFRSDWNLALQFHDCCAEVSEKQGHPQWPGCFIVMACGQCRRSPGRS